MIRDLHTLKKHLDSGSLQENDIVPIMTVIRNELENKNEKEKYKFLNLFCNWCVHPQITKSITALEMIELLTESVVQHDQSEGKSIHGFRKNIVERFYNELKVFFLVNNLNLGFFNDKKPHLPFFYLVIKVIVNRPLVMPDDKFIANRKLKDRKKKITDIMSSISSKKNINLNPKGIMITEEISAGKTNYLLNLITENVAFSIPLFNIK